MEIDHLGRKAYGPNLAAFALDLSRAQVYRLMKSGVIRYVTIGSARKIPAEEIDRLAREGTQPTEITD